MGLFLGRTVPSFRLMLEGEIAKWKEFIKALPGSSDKEAFEELMNYSRSYASAAGAAVRPIVSDAMFMSILLAHEKELIKIKVILEKLNNTTDDERKLPIVPAGQT
jgi:hypothetical protein